MAGAPGPMHNAAITNRPARLGAVGAVVLGSVACLAVVPLAVVAVRARPAYDLSEWVIGGYAPAFLVSGWWLVRRRPRLNVGWMLLVAGVTCAVAALGAAWAAAAYGEEIGRAHV